MFPNWYLLYVKEMLNFSSTCLPIVIAAVTFDS